MLPRHNPSQNAQMGSGQGSALCIGGQAGADLYVDQYQQMFQGDDNQNQDLESREAAKFREKLEQAQSLLREIRRQIKERINNIKPDEEQEALRNLIDDIQKFFGEEEKLKGIEKDQEASTEAANWIHTHLHEISSLATEAVFSQNPLPELKNLESENFSLDERKKRFTQTIAGYLSCLKIYISAGTPAWDIQQRCKNDIYLDFSNKVYIDAFKYIKDKLVLSNENGLSEEAARSIIIYINRFLIDRALASHSHN